MFRRTPLFLILVTLFILVACADKAAPTAAPTVPAPATGPTPADDQFQPSPTDAGPTAIPPTPTPEEPLAALVNGQPIYLAEYEKELSRYEQAQSELGLVPGGDDPDYRTVVLDALIETELIAQAAAASGIVITPEMIEERLLELEEASGGPENFAAWLQANQWTVDEFRVALAREMVTEKMVEQVTADVPSAVEQVRARYIQVDDPTLAQTILDQLSGGGDFATLAQQYSLDRVTGENGGDLGFFSRGSLLVPEVEAAAFALQPGQVSAIIQAPRADGSGITYYLVTVVERDPQRPLEANLRFQLLQEKFESWLAERWAEAQVTRFVESGA